MADGIGLAEKMLGLPGLVVLEVDDVPGEVVVRVESTRPDVVCPSCRRRAEAHDRTEVHLRDVHCFGRPCRLVINKRRWRCKTPGCMKKTWTEEIAGIAPRQVLTSRAGAEVTRQVGQLCRSVASVADEYGVGWDTAWAAVELHGTPLVDEPSRVGRGPRPRRRRALLSLCHPGALDHLRHLARRPRPPHRDRPLQGQKRRSAAPMVRRAHRALARAQSASWPWT